MDSVLGDLWPKIAVVYIDHIKILSPTLEQYHEDVNHVLERLNVANLIFNINKCSFAKEEVVVIEVKVSKNGINLTLAKFQVVNDVGLLKNVSGSNRSRNVYFYRRFILNFTTLAEP